MAPQPKLQLSNSLNERLTLFPNILSQEGDFSCSDAYILGFYNGNVVNYLGICKDIDDIPATSMFFNGLVYFKDIPDEQMVKENIDKLSIILDDKDFLKPSKEDKNSHLYLICYYESKLLVKKIFDFNTSSFTGELTIVDDSKLFIHSAFSRVTTSIKLDFSHKSVIKKSIDDAIDSFSQKKKGLEVHLRNSSFTSNKIDNLQDSSEKFYDYLDQPVDLDIDYLPQMSKKEKQELLTKWKNKMKSQRSCLDFLLKNELFVPEEENVANGYYKLVITIYVYIHVNNSISRSIQTLLFNIRQQLGNLKNLNLESVGPGEIRTCSFVGNAFNHILSTTYVISDTVTDYKALKSQRQSLHKSFFLPTDRPMFRYSQRIRNLKKTTSDEENGYLCNVHSSISDQSGMKSCSHSSIIEGTHAYHHYMQDKFNDNGWGCAYRSLQTIVSWFKNQGYIYSPDVQWKDCSQIPGNKEMTTNEKRILDIKTKLQKDSRVPNHEEIQTILHCIGDKPSSFVGSKQWIGSQEICYVLNTLFNIDSKFISVNSGSELVTKARDLCNHFSSQSTPVMIGGGSLAHTIIGVHFEEKNGDVSYLILDPHYTGPEDLYTILKKGWCGWKKNSFWDKTSFYNLCLPLRYPDY